LVGEHTLLQDTVLRLKGVKDVGAPLVICNQGHRFMVAEQMRQIKTDPAAIILEPVGRNTAPAVALAALFSQKDGDDPILAILPSDHVLSDLEVFRTALEAGKKLAQEGSLVTFGIVPNRPETGFGYILRSPRPLRFIENGSFDAYTVKRFVEKPDQSTAQSYLDSGQYVWNSGMFLFKASSIVFELERFCPDILDSCRRAMQGACSDPDFTRLDEQPFLSCRPESIDFAVMEKTDNAVVIPLKVGWDDVGSWHALWKLGESDSDGNVLHGDVIIKDCHGTLFHSSGRLVAGLGLKNLVVVETSDAVLVADRDQAQRVTEIAEKLKAEKRHEA
jgi:mannose-1-phosphate guanylyltransferase/mannose-6-phosphate isomerase